MTMTLKEAKIILDEFENRKDKWHALNELIDAGVLESREYTLEEIGYLMGITKQGIRALEQSALKKLAKFANRYGV